MATLSSVLFNLVRPDSRRTASGTALSIPGSQMVTVSVGGSEVQAVQDGDVTPGQAVLLIRTDSGYVARPTGQMGRVLKRIQIDG